MLHITKSEDILTGRLELCYTGAVYDVMRNMGYPDQLLPNHIRPMNLQHKIAGPVFTVTGAIDQSLDKDTSLLKWCEMLSVAPAGHVLICQPNDDTLAHMGELSAETLTYKGIKGYIVDGGCRDSSFIESIGFPVFCTYFTPRDVVATWSATEMGASIMIGGVYIRTGDFVLADRDGIIIIPKAKAEEVVTKTEEIMRTENLVRKAILSGTDPVDAYLKFKKF
ncbi:Regulator of RNase E activity RraA [Pedobacter westerhofensis]|uniref:Putative 4-hydroxy-4-methyl-2-oxoglutarate aldolase n=1 Tax=Pedobacter westerhofensis TaxID=425512 RepID=A0A521FRN7_9SPHI|nr:RraA family protein [Pedobacter westerhofensis]SMO98897.1 Regulator of RNase E activity RraA [Pedobacter westerhofensis]